MKSTALIQASLGSRPVAAFMLCGGREDKRCKAGLVRSGQFSSIQFCDTGRLATKIVHAMQILHGRICVWACFFAAQ
ncbi:hypothetical protein ACFPOB_20955 [Bosea eneae]|uniref:Uncharacterized protein n=1 Tax=Bosea eneae TaxID=151454 RepID=A0ABW0J122_9HYPH